MQVRHRLPALLTILFSVGCPTWAASTSSYPLPQTGTNSPPEARQATASAEQPGLELQQLGSLNAIDHPRVERIFTVRNNRKLPLVIARLESTCGCISSIVTGSGGTAAGLPITLQPGRQVSVRVLLDLTRLPPGPLHKTVYAFSPDSSQPVAAMDMSGALLPSIRFSPAFVDFGRLPVGQARVLTVTAAIDARLAPGGRLPVLASSNPSVRISPTTATATQETKPITGPAMLTQTYAITLSPDTPIGPLNGSLHLDAGKDVLPLGRDLMERSAVMLIGYVSGDLSAQPQMVSFGPVPAGHETRRQVALTGVTPEAVLGLQVVSPKPWLMASLDKPAPGDSSSQARVLDLTLSAAAPSGVLQVDVEVRLLSGRRLRIPVMGYILPRATTPR